MTRFRFARPLLCGVVLAVALGACSTAKVESDSEVSDQVKHRPAVVYVADFDLQQEAVTSEGLLSHLPLHDRKAQSDARPLVGVMADAIVSELGKKGVEAHRFATGAPLPRQGWLVRGAFLQIDEGDRLKRAIVGFGAGHVDMQVAVTIDDLSAGKAPVPLYQLQTGAESGKAPGAVLTLNPYAAAVKFVLSGRDLGTEAKNSAAKIAGQVLAHIDSAS
jgi:hypothetical protein